MSKLILTDVDGVLLDWITPFESWMDSKGYAKVNHSEYDIEQIYGISLQEAIVLFEEYHESSLMESLPSWEDAKEYTYKLHNDHGYRFHCITAVPSTTTVYNMRKRNLESVFGDSAIAQLDCVGSSKNKRPVLEMYRDTGMFWIEDVFPNAVMGADLGLTSILIDYHYNSNVHDQRIKKVKTWKEIYDLIVEKE